MSEAETEQRPEPSVLRSLRGIPGTVLNEKPDRRYFIANPTDESSNLGLQACLDVGWHEVKAKSDPERLRGGAVQPNGRVTWKGQVLLWIESTKYDALTKEVVDATSELFMRAKGPGGIEQVVDVTGKLATDM